MVDTHIYSRWVHVFSMGYPVIVAYKTSNWPTGARLELFEALCLQTWLAGKSPTGFVDFPMKNTFFKPPCIAGGISQLARILLPSVVSRRGARCYPRNRLMTC